MRSKAAPALLFLVLAAAATGCGDDEPPHDAAGRATASPRTPATSASASPTPTAGSSAAAPASVPPFSANTEPDDGGQGSGNGLGLTDVRVAQHPGFDRVVFELGGKGEPGWRVEYVPRPLADGSGEPVRLKGTAYLQVVLRGIGLPDDIDIPPYGNHATRVPGTGTQGVAEIAPGGFFEGDQQAFIGLTGEQRPFRAFALANPARVVVDVQHD
jgi:hypothetical protein